MKIWTINESPSFFFQTFRKANSWKLPACDYASSGSSASEILPKAQAKILVFVYNFFCQFKLKKSSSIETIQFMILFQEPSQVSGQPIWVALFK